MRVWIRLLVCWAGALLLPNYAPTPALALRLPEAGAGPRVQVYTLWSRQHLCLGARVPDTMLTGSSVAPMSAPEQDDAVEFCLEAPTPKGPVAFRLAISVAGGMTVLRQDPMGNWRTDPSWITGPRTVKFAVVSDGTLNHPSDTDTGFVVECAIPWEFLTGGEAPAGQRLGFNVVCWLQGESQGITSWSPMVHSEDDVGDTARWGSLVVSYSAGPSAATGAVVECSFAGFTPFIDGRLAAEEWLTASTLAFSKPEPAVGPVAAGAKPETAGTLLAVYRYDWQGQPDRPGAKLWAESGLPSTIDQPKEGCGPWQSYERVAWHRQQLEEMTRAGIDIILARYQGDEEPRKTWARIGLDRLTHALKERRAEGRSYPLVGMLLETSALRGVDLKSDSGKRLLYGMIRDFFLHVPPEFRAQLGAQASGGRAGGVPVLLGEPDALADWDSTFLSYCDEKFAQDFPGGRIAWLGSAEWGKHGADSFYAHLRLDGKIGLTQEAVGGAAAMSISPGYCAPGLGGELRSRREGRSYRMDWQRILASRPEVVVINSWNDFSDASEIAPSRQYGYTYGDMTQLFKARLGSDQPRYLRLKQGSVPRVMKPGATYLVEMLVENIGTQEVRTGRQVTADYRIVRPSDNTVVQEKIAAQALLIPPGQTRRLPVEIITKDGEGKPLPPGEYLFSLAVMKTRVSYLRSRWFAKPIAELTVPIIVGEPPARQATVISTSLPSAIESGATENVVVRLRNDGAERWRVGATKLAYHWIRYRDDLTASSAEARETMTFKGARADLPRDVSPGEVVSVMIPVSAVLEDGAPLPPSGPEDLWHYRLQWDMVAGEDGWFSGGSGQVAEEAIQVVEHDWGVVFKAANVPAEMSAGQTLEAEVTLANAGRRKWVAGALGARSASNLACAWYYWDGQRCNTDSARASLPRDVSPGETIALKPKVTAPGTAGTYWLVWRMEHAVETPAKPAGGWRDDLLVIPVLVRGGRFRTLDLSSLVNVAAVTTDSYRTRGDFDGQGRSWPEECLPPDLSGARMNIYPSSYYAALADDPVPFSFPDASGRVGGAVACNRQTIALSDRGVKAVYLLAASTSGERNLELTLSTAAGEVERCSVTVPSWTGPDQVHLRGAYAPYLRGLSADDASMPAYLYVLPVKPQGFDMVTSLELPKDPSVKVIAITVEEE